MTEVMVACGLAVHGVDASPRLLAEFRRRVPEVPVECGDMLATPWFGRAFDGIVAWGLVFLLDPAAQRRLLVRAARALAPGGRFVFTAPAQPGQWPDSLTGRSSRSLGAATYRAALREAGLELEREFEDAGDNHYYAARRALPDVRVTRC